MSRPERVDKLLLQIRQETIDAFDECAEILNKCVDLKRDNDKLRALVSSVLVIRHDPTYKWLDARLAEICGKGFTEQARDLGIEVGQ